MYTIGTIGPINYLGMVPSNTVKLTLTLHPTRSREFKLVYVQ